jgi:acyl-CoA reductase-like NAD-dependent aldehyde dehydrogenase
MANYPDLRLFIAGDWRQADAQRVVNPADESVLGIVPHARRSHLDDALSAADKASRSGHAPRRQSVRQSVPSSSSKRCGSCASASRRWRSR